MVFWIILLALLLIYPTDKKGICIYFFVIVGTISAIRYNIGYDYANYVDVIEGNYMYDITYDRLEVIPKILIWLTKMTGHTQSFFVMTSYAIIGIMAYYIYKNSGNKKLSIMLFMSVPLFFWSSLSIVRQLLAVCIGLLMMMSIYEGKIKKALIFYVLAVLSHNSAYVLILAFLAKKIDVSSKIYLVIYIASFTLFSVFYGLILKYGEIFIFERALLYVEMNEELKGNTSLWILFNLIYIAMYFVIKIKSLGPQSKYYYTLFYIGVILFNVFSPVAVLAGRLSLYFLVVIITLLPNVIIVRFKQTRRLVNMLVYIVCIVLYVYTLHLATSSYEKGITVKDPYCPYKTVLTL